LIDKRGWRSKVSNLKEKKRQKKKERGPKPLSSTLERGKKRRGKGVKGGTERLDRSLSPKKRRKKREGGVACASRRQRKGKENIERLVGWKGRITKSLTL